MALLILYVTLKKNIKLPLILFKGEVSDQTSKTLPLVASLTTRTYFKGTYDQRSQRIINL